MIKAFIIDWPLRKWSFSRIPAIAEKMGLHYIESEYIGKAGTIKGKLDGFDIEIVPDDSIYSTIRINLNHKDDELEISIDRPKMKPGKNKTDFNSGNRKFNFIFKTRRIHRERVTGISAYNDFFNSAAGFYSKWLFRMDALFIDSGELCCKFRFGFYFFPYIPAGKIQQISYHLIETAKKHREAARS